MRQGRVRFFIRGKEVEIGCEAGTEGEVSALGDAVNARVEQLARDTGSYDPTRLLLMAAILAEHDAQRATDIVEALTADLEGLAEAVEGRLT
jgi:cell division protein ZapA (FtsZ GTPase activity inhibitor)